MPISTMGIDKETRSARLRLGGGTIRGDTPIVVEMCEMPTVINLNKDDFQSKTILDIHGIAPSICAGEGGE